MFLPQRSVACSHFPSTRPPLATPHVLSKKKRKKGKSLSCVRLFATPMDCSLPGSSVHGILQARVLEWVAISFSRRSSRPRIRPGSPASWADALPSEPLGESTVHNADPDDTQLGGSPVLQPTWLEKGRPPPALALRLLSTGLGQALSAPCQACLLLLPPSRRLPVQPAVPPPQS